ncbi:ROK family protein [Corynebacterium mendelii]|uniref:ROK family transcriptional regulator n=1 Tax=Corynebacterium mendelii TaxID=2765362 RepID=A0A939DYN2_9CORY|nr:ROK family transcriptional regulator [Corynebacterium mendelii]MBN9643229.1 ROK family transcriptional regulator [Corynebacterium mendelii]
MTDYHELTALFRRTRKAGQIIRHLSAAPATRAELADHLGFDSGTVSRSVAKLISIGLVVEGEATKPGQVGRPSPVVYLNTDALWICGLHIGVYSLSVTCVDVTGRPGDRVSVPHGQSPSSVVAAAAEAIRSLCARRGSDPLGVGVAVGGWVDTDGSTVLRFPALDWHRVPLGAHLEKELGLPVKVQSVARSHAQSNLVFGLVQPDATFGHLYVGSVIEFALSHHGQVLCGELGDGMLDQLPVRTIDGRTGTARSLVSDGAVTEQAIEAKVLRPGDTFEVLMDVAVTDTAEGEKTRRILSRRVDNCAALIACIHEVLPLPKIVVSASIIRQPCGFTELCAAVAARSWVTRPPTLIHGGEVITSTAQAAASPLWMAVTNP